MNKPDPPEHEPDPKRVLNWFALVSHLVCILCVFVGLGLALAFAITPPRPDWPASGMSLLLAWGASRLLRADLRAREASNDARSR